MIIRLTLESLIATLDGVAIVGLVDQHRASPHIGADVVGIESDRLVIVAHGAVGVRLFVVGIAATDEVVGFCRIKRDRATAVLDGTIVGALGGVGRTAIVEGVGVVWPQLKCLVVVFDGVVVLAQAVVDISPVVECYGILGVELDRLVVIARRAVVIAPAEICVAPNDVGGGQLSALVFFRRDRGSAGGNRRFPLRLETCRQILGRRGGSARGCGDEDSGHGQGQAGSG